MWPTSKPVSSGSFSGEIKRDGIAITGSNDSRGYTLSRKVSRRPWIDEEREEEEDEDVVSWSSLLVALHDRQQIQLLQDIRHLSAMYAGEEYPVFDINKLSNGDQNLALVCIKPKTRSWDLMPPDVVRPMASTTLGTLITIAHRLGMVWLDLIPRDGKLRAESMDSSISATLLRGLGIVVEYNLGAGPQFRSGKDLLPSFDVPSHDADKVRFCKLPDYKHSLRSIRWHVA
jgi:hypothetical protein